MTDNLTALAETWEREARELREEFARDVHPALAHGHKEANLLDRHAADLRAALGGSDVSELERARSGARTLGTVVTALSRSLKAAYIELAQGHPAAAKKWVLNAVPGETWDGDEWDGQETAQEWFDRTEKD
jgi:hypothetical protein